MLSDRVLALLEAGIELQGRAFVEDLDDRLAAVGADVAALVDPLVEPEAS